MALLVDGNIQILAPEDVRNEKTVSQVIKKLSECYQIPEQVLITGN